MNSNSRQQEVERLRQAGLRVTETRLRILAALQEDRTHPTAEELFDELRRDHPSLSRSTVYNTLESFLRTGLCQRVNADGSLRVDGIPDAHDHAICRRCGRIFDIDRSLNPADVPGRLPRGLEVHSVHIEYDVTCADCRARKST